MDWRRPKIQVTDEELERLRSAYRALGPGFPAAALGLFEPEAGAGEGEWCVKMFGSTARCLNAGALASTDLFALPPSWEVMRTEVRGLARRRSVVTVSGFMYCRPRGTWEKIRVPLLHVWTLSLGKALRFENLLDGIELSPARRRTRKAA